MSEKQIGLRLAMRVEGSAWVAYAAKMSTMKGAIWLGSIAMKLVERADRKDQFMRLMQGAFGDILHDISGSPPEWNEPQPAPEHERVAGTPEAE